MSQSGILNRNRFKPGTVVQTLEGNTGGPVPPDLTNNIHIVGDGVLVTVDGDPGTSTLTIELDGSIPNQFDTDSGSAIPLAHVLDIVGTGGIATSGVGSTVTIDGGDLDVDYVTDSGTAHQAAGILNIVGNNLLNTSGSGNTVTVALDLSLDGQIPIGSSAGDTAFATITAGTNVSVTNGNNSITIAANTGAVVYNYVSINNSQSPYSALATDYYISVNCVGGAVTVRLPNAPTTGRVFVIKDQLGASASNNITVTTVGGAVNIDGATTFVMNTAYQAASFIFNSTGYEVF